MSESNLQHADNSASQNQSTQLEQPSPDHARVAYIGCSAKCHMDTYAYCIYDEIGALTNGGKTPFYREGDVHSVYCGIGRATAYRRFVSLVESGWLVNLDAGERNRRPNGHYFPTRFRFVKHSEWVKSHPEGCDKRIMEVWNAKLRKGAPDNTSVENVVADYTTKKARTKWAKELSSDPVETASYPTETNQVSVSTGDSQLSHRDSQLSTGDESVSAGAHITRLPVLVTCKDNPYPLTPVSTGDNLQNSTSDNLVTTFELRQDGSALAPALSRAADDPGKDLIGSPEAVLSRLMATRGISQYVTPYNHGKWLAALRGLGGIDEARIVSSASRQCLDGIGTGVIAEVFAENVRKEFANASAN